MVSASAARASLSLVIVALTVFLLVRGWRGWAEAAGRYPWDGLIAYEGARVLGQGVNPYSPEGAAQTGLTAERGLGYPPSSLPWMLPFADLDLMAMKVAWAGLTTSLLAGYLLVLALAQGWPRPRLWLPFSFAAALSMSWMTLHLQVAQFSVLIAFLCLLAWDLARRGQPMLGGFALGLAATIKFYPAVIVLSLLLLGEWRVTAGAALGWSALAIPVTARVGLYGWKQFIVQLQPYVPRWTWHIRNASIHGIVQRLAHPVCENIPENPLHAPPWRTGQWLAALLSLVVIALGVAAARLHGRRTGRRDVAFALFTTLSLVTGPYTWEHYRAGLIFPVTLLWLEAVRRPDLGRGLRTLLAACAIGCAALCAGNVDAKLDAWNAWNATPAPARTALMHVHLHWLETANWLSYWIAAAGLWALCLADRPVAPSPAAGTREG